MSSSDCFFSVSKLSSSKRDRTCSTLHHPHAPSRLPLRAYLFTYSTNFPFFNLDEKDGGEGKVGVEDNFDREAV